MNIREEYGLFLEAKIIGIAPIVFPQKNVEHEKK